MRRMAMILGVVVGATACSSGAGSGGAGSATTGADEAAGSTLPATACVATVAPEGRLVHVTLDDVVGGFGSLGSRSDSGLTPGIVRIELEADAENAAPAAVRILLGDVHVASITGVAAGQTCGIDLEVAAGTYHVVDDANHDVEFDVAAG